MRVSNPLELELQIVVSHHVGGCWKLNFGSLKEQYVLAGFVCQLDTAGVITEKEPPLRKCLHEIQL